MTGKTLWQNLIKLVECDKKIYTDELDIKKLEQSIIANKTLIEKLEAGIKELQAQHHEELKNVDGQELQAQTLKEQEDAFRKQIDDVHNQKEYHAIQKQLTNIVKQRQEQEEVVLSSWHNLESAKNKLEKTTKEYTQRIEKLKTEISQAQENIKSAEENVVTGSQERKQLEKNVSDEWMTKYNRMKNTVEDPIVPVIRNSCSSCFYAILSKDLVRLKNADMVPCRSCYRFLYYDQDEEKTADQASY